MATRVQYQQDGSCLSAVNCNCVGGSDTKMTNLSVRNQNQTREEMKETEGVLASEMSKLTIQERTKAMDDLHCVGKDLEETPGMMERSLQMFGTALQQHEHDSFYDMARRQNRAYVEDPSFRIRFIRANYHDVDKAVSQMILFLQTKAKYFGTECIGRDLTFKDLSEDDRELLMSGAYHVQAERDQNGRTVVYALSKMIGRSKGESLCRVVYFIYFNVLGAIPEVQMKGIVLIFYDMTKIDEKQSLPTLGLSVALMKMIKCLPVRFSARHFCMKTRNGKLNPFDPILKVVCDLATEYSIVRTKLHYGSDLENQYSVRGHGVSLKSFPINPEGELREDILSVWLQDYLKMEESESNMVFGDNEAKPSTTAGIDGEQGKHGAKSLLIIPNDTDILLGRGRFTQRHLGNIRFRDSVEERNEEYDLAPKRRRQEIITEMRRIIAAKGVRFLKQVEKDVWEEITSKESEKKIAQLFREFRKQK